MDIKWSRTSKKSVVMIKLIISQQSHQGELITCAVCYYDRRMFLDLQVRASVKLLNTLLAVFAS